MLASHDEGLQENRHLVRSWQYYAFASGADGSNGTSPAAGLLHRATVYRRARGNEDPHVPDGTTTSRAETIQFTAEDSQRRMFFSETQLATGRRSFSIDDPIAGEKIIWNTNFPIAKMLKYPTLPKAVRPAGRFRRRHWTLGTENRRSACQESLAASRRTERA